MSEWKEAAIEYKYAEIPEKPRYKKKKKKKKIKKSDHKHIYVPCMYNTSEYVVYRNGEKTPMLYYGTYCEICGRIGDITYNTNKLTEKLPIYKISFLDKYIPIGDNND